MRSGRRGQKNLFWTRRPSMHLADKLDGRSSGSTVFFRASQPIWKSSFTCQLCHGWRWRRSRSLGLTTQPDWPRKPRDGASYRPRVFRAKESGGCAESENLPFPPGANQSLAQPTKPARIRMSKPSRALVTQPVEVLSTSIFRALALVPRPFRSEGALDPQTDLAFAAL